MKSKKSSLTKNDYKYLFLAILITIATPFASDTYTPSLPFITEALDSTTDKLQYTMSFYFLAVAVSQLFYGPLSDRFGRRPVILIGLAITIVGSLLCAFAFSANTLILARFIQGAGVGVSNSLYRAVVRDKFLGAKMAVITSFAGMAYTVGFASAPVIGGYIQHFLGWRAVFIFVSLLITVIFLCLFKKLDETQANPDVSATKLINVWRNYKRLLHSFNFVGYAIVSGLAFSGIIAYYTSAPFLMEKILQLSPVAFGWLSVGLAVGLLLGQYLNALLVTRLGVTFLILVGLCVMLLSGFVMLLYGLWDVLNSAVIIIPVVVYCIASGLVFANAMANAFRTIGHGVGTAGAMYGFIQILCTAVTSALVALVHEQSQVPLASIFTGLAVLALLFFCALGTYSRLHRIEDE